MLKLNENYIYYYIINNYIDNNKEYKIRIKLKII